MSAPSRMPIPSLHIGRILNPPDPSERSYNMSSASTDPAICGNEVSDAPSALTSAAAAQDPTKAVPTTHSQVPVPEDKGRTAPESDMTSVQSTLAQVPLRTHEAVPQTVPSPSDDGEERRALRYKRAEGSKHPGLVLPKEAEWSSFFQVSTPS